MPLQTKIMLQHTNQAYFTEWNCMAAPGRNNPIVPYQKSYFGETKTWNVSINRVQKKRATKKGTLLKLLPPDALNITHKIHTRLVH